MLRSWGGGRKETPTLEMEKHRATKKPMDFVLKDMIFHIEIRSFNFLIPPIPENSQLIKPPALILPAETIPIVRNRKAFYSPGFLFRKTQECWERIPKKFLGSPRLKPQAWELADPKV